MNSYDITDQVISQLTWYAERISYLNSIGRLDDALVLSSSAQLMAECADSQGEWIVVE